MSSESQPRALITPDDLVGFEIDGRYRLDAIVGGGGMGVVYRTTQHNLNRDIAIKLLKLDDVDGKSRLDRFKREIDIIAQLTHPNIVRVFDTGQDPVLGLHYIAMELVDGGSLAEVMRGHRMKPELAIDIAYEVAAALTEPHKLGIVHRDIKPANVLMTVQSDDTLGVKVVDFGIARGQSTGNSKITTTGVVVGSPMYMAPEVARGETLDGRTDLYSLGVLMYEMLTGDTPFRGSTPVAIMLRHAVEDPPSLGDALGDDFPVPELIRLVDRMLGKEKKQRPEDAKAVMRELQNIRVTHGMKRVEVADNASLVAALSTYLRPVNVPAGPELDPLAPTTPIDAAETPDSFHGWLVPDDARDALRETAAAPVPTITSEDSTPPAPAPSSRLGGAIAAVTTAAIGVGVAVWWISGEPPVEPVEATSTVTVPAQDQVEPPPLVEPAATEPATVLDAGPTDAGETADLTAADGTSAEVAESPPTAPRDPKPANETKKTKDDEFQKGMEWLHKK